MKKALSVFLSILLVFSGICSVLMVPAVANTVDFEDTSKWVIYDYSVSHVNSTAKLADSWANITKNESSAYVCDGDYSLHLVAPWQVPSFVFDVEKNTDYTLSFKYFDPTAPTECPLKNAGVINNDYCISWGNPYNQGFFSCIGSDFYYESNGLFDQKVINWNLKTSTNYVAGDWNEITLNFNSYDNTSLTFMLIASSNPLYLDAFELTVKGEPEPTPDPAPDPTPDPGTSEAEKWQVYAKGEATSLDGTATNREGWNSVSDNTDTAYNCGDIPSVKYYGSHSTVARPLSLESGKKYKISFKYYMPDSTIPSESGDSLFYQIGIAKKGTTIASNGRPVSAAYGAEALGQKNTWNEYSLEYENTDSTEKFLFLFTVFSAGYTVYFADVKAEDITPEPEPTPDPEPTTSEAEKWQVYAKGEATSLDGTATNREGWNSVSDNTDTAYNCGDIPSVKYYGSHSTVARPLSLESGKKYKISFKYYMPDSTIPSESGDSLFYQIGIAKKGTTIASNGRPVSATYGAEALGRKNTWNEYSLEYENTDSTEKFLFLFTVFSAGYTVYFADVKAEDITPEPGPEPEPEPTPDPEPTTSEAEKWQVYLKEEGKTAIDGTATNREGWNSISDNANAAFNYGDIPTVKLYGSHSTVARPLTGLETEKSYKVSVKYYMTTDTVPDSSGEALFYKTGILAEGTALNGSYPADTIVYGDPCLGEKGKWQEYSIVFTNWDSKAKYFYICPVFSAGYTVYFADFKVEEIQLENPGIRPFYGWGDEPLGEYMINFDNFAVNFSESYVEVTDKGPERNGEQSNTLHVIKGDYPNAVFPKWGTVTTYTDPIFTLNVKENTLYEYSFWIYIDEKAENIQWLQFFYDYSTPGAYILLNKTRDVGKWMQYTARFVTKAGQKQISLGFNAGETPNDMWLDEFKIREIAPGTLTPFRYGGYCEDMHNLLMNDRTFKNIEASKSGVYKINVQNSTQYTFGINVKSNKKSNSRVFLSYDGVNPIMPSDTAAVPAEIGSVGQSRRYAIDVVSNNSGYMYLVVENDDGALTFEEPALFKTFALSSGISLESVEPIDRKLAVNKEIKELEKLSTEGVFFENDDYYESPSTGDHSIPLIILIITFVISAGLLVLTKKGGEQA